MYSIISQSRETDIPLLSELSDTILKCTVKKNSRLKDAVLRLKQFSAIESPLKMMEHGFYFTSKALIYQDI